MIDHTVWIQILILILLTSEETSEWIRFMVIIPKGAEAAERAVRGFSSGLGTRFADVVAGEWPGLEGQLAEEVQPFVGFARLVPKLPIMGEFISYLVIIWLVESPIFHVLARE